MSKKIENQEYERHEIRRAVLALVLEGDGVQAFQAVDAKQIAERVGWTPDKVRRVMAEAHGCVSGLSCEQVARGPARVWVYEPNVVTWRAIGRALSVFVQDTERAPKIAALDPKGMEQARLALFLEQPR